MISRSCEDNIKIGDPQPVLGPILVLVVLPLCIILLSFVVSYYAGQREE